MLGAQLGVANQAKTQYFLTCLSTRKYSCTKVKRES